MTAESNHSMDDVIVRCRRLTRSFIDGRSHTVAVRDVSCCIRAGQQIALMGPSGSGKSTLLHLFAGLDNPTTGTISWPALPLSPVERARSIGMAFQGGSLMEALTAGENVEFPLVLRGVDPVATRDAATVALSKFQILGIREKLPEELSGGQAQRVGLARAVATQPRLILADEPTGQVDHKLARQTIDALLGQSLDTGAAVLIATHDPEIARRFPLRWRMSGGRMETPNLERSLPEVPQ